MLSDLSHTPVAETIRRLSAERRSGDLQVRSGKLAKLAFFDHGRIVFAASNLKKDRLGEALVAAGRITDEQFQRASALMREGDQQRRFGEALVQAGVLDKRELGHSVARQVKRIVLSLFELDAGAASFEERRCPIPLEFMVSLSVHRMLYAGIRSMTSRELVLAGLGDLDRWVTLAEVPPFPFGVKKCSAEELEILEQSKRRATLRRLAWSSGGLSFSRLRAAYAFLASGILQEPAVPQGQPAAAQPIVQMETSTFLLSALQRRPDRSARDVIRQEVNEELARSAKLDRENWLRVSSVAPREELIRALEAKMERYHALHEAVEDDEDLKTDIELIVGRASSMLRLSRQAPAPAAASRAEAAETPAGSAPTVRAADTAAPAQDAASEPAPTPPILEEPRPAAPIEAAAEPPAPEPAVEREPAHEPGMLDTDSQIEHLLLEGSVKMTVSDYASAVQSYLRLVELAPRVAAYRVRLAIAMALWPKTAKQAEREFLEAIRLDPNNADIHYQFGIYYKAMKVRSRAVAELRTALSLSPRHKQARADLEALSPKDSALTSLKRLLR